QRIDRRRRGHVGYEPRAAEPVRAIDIHGAGTADALPARTAEGERRVHLVLDPEESVENHWPAIVEVDLEGIEAWVITGIRIVAINLERLDAHCAGRPRPSLPPLDACFGGHTEISRHWKPLEKGSARHLIGCCDDHCAFLALGDNAKRTEDDRRAESRASSAAGSGISAMAQPTI